jgi:hypothetical protein
MIEEQRTHDSDAGETPSLRSLDGGRWFALLSAVGLDPHAIATTFTPSQQTGYVRSFRIVSRLSGHLV